VYTKKEGRYNMDIDIDEKIPVRGKDRSWKMKIEKLIDYEWWNKRKVNVFKRRASKEEYQSPMILLDSKYKDLIGRYYVTFRGKAVCSNMFLGKETQRIEGDCIVLFFDSNWKKGDEPPVKRGV
jgi:hypothetical protein